MSLRRQMLNSISTMSFASIFGANYYDDFDFDLPENLTLTGSSIDSVKSKISTRIFSSSGSNRPTLVANQVNGKAVARFDGTDDFMTIASSTALYNFLHNSTGGCVIVVAKITDANPNAVMIILDNTNTSNINTGYYIGYDDRVSQSREDLISSGVTRSATPGVSGSLSGTDTFLTQQFNSVINIVDNSNATLIERNRTIINGGAEIKPNTANGTASSGNATFVLTMGKRGSNNDFYLKGDISRIVIINRVPTADEILKVKTVLTTKYGI